MQSDNPSPPPATTAGAISANVANGCEDSKVKKTFKSQSLNSLFRKDLSPTKVPSTSPSPRIAYASLTKSSSPKTPPAQLSRSPVVALETATGSFKLAAMSSSSSSSDPKGSSIEPSSSATVSPRPASAAGAEPPTVWRKDLNNSSSTNVHNSVTPSTAETRQTSSPSPGTLSSLSPTTKHTPILNTTTTATESSAIAATPAQPAPSVADAPKTDTTASILSGRSFSWGDDDEDDNDEWKKELEYLATTSLKNKPLPDQSKPQTPPAKSVAPWAAHTTQRPPAAVPIDQQLKELTERKNREGAHPGGPSRPMRRRLTPTFDEFGRSGALRYRQDYHDDNSSRYRYHDYERRYKPGDSPSSKEIYNPRMDKFEPAPMRSDRRRSEDHMTTTYVYKAKRHDDTAGGGPAVPPAGAPKEMPSPSTSSNDMKGAVAPSSAAAPPPPAGRPSVLSVMEQQKELMRQSRENARRRKEEELQREKEHEMAAKKKAEELARKMEEHEQEERQRQQQQQKQRQQELKRKEHLQEPSRPINKGSKQRTLSTVSIDQRALDTVNALIGDEEDNIIHTRKPSEPTNNIGTGQPLLNHAQVSPSTGTAPSQSKLWNSWAVPRFGGLFDSKRGFLDDSTILDTKSLLDSNSKPFMDDSCIHDEKKSFPESSIARPVSSPTMSSGKLVGPGAGTTGPSVPGGNGSPIANGMVDDIRGTSRFFPSRLYAASSAPPSSIRLQKQPPLVPVAFTGYNETRENNGRDISSTRVIFPSAVSVSSSSRPYRAPSLNSIESVQKNIRAQLGNSVSLGDLPLTIPPTIAKIPVEEEIDIPPLLRDQVASEQQQQAEGENKYNRRDEKDLLRKLPVLKTRTVGRSHELEMILLGDIPAESAKVRINKLSYNQASTGAVSLPPAIPEIQLPARDFSTSLYKADLHGFWHEREFRQRTIPITSVILPGTGVKIRISGGGSPSSSRRYPLSSSSRLRRPSSSHLHHRPHHPHSHHHIKA